MVNYEDAHGFGRNVIITREEQMRLSTFFHHHHVYFRASVWYVRTKVLGFPAEMSTIPWFLYRIDDQVAFYLYRF